jgi:hypothetical protein
MTTLYSGEKYGGTALNVVTGNSITTINQKVKSLKVDPKNFIDAYTGINYSGKHIRVYGPAQIPQLKFNQIVGENISSIKVFGTSLDPIVQLSNSANSNYTIISLVNFGGYPVLDEFGMNGDVKSKDPQFGASYITMMKTQVQAMIFANRAYYDQISTVTTSSSISPNANSLILIDMSKSSENVVGIAPNPSIPQASASDVPFLYKYNQTGCHSPGDLRYNNRSGDEDRCVYLDYFACPAINGINGTSKWQTNTTGSAAVDHFYSPTSKYYQDIYGTGQDSLTRTTRMNAVKCTYPLQTFQTIDDIDAFRNPQTQNHPITGQPYHQKWDNDVETQINTQIMPFFCAQPAPTGTCKSTLLDPVTKLPAQNCSRFMQSGKTGDACLAWALNDTTGKADAAMESYCSSYNTPDCRCVKSSTDSEYNLIKTNFNGFNKRCFFLPCTDERNYLVPRAVRTADCPEQICQQIVQCVNCGTAYFDNISQKMGCEGGARVTNPTIPTGGTPGSSSNNGGTPTGTPSGTPPSSNSQSKSSIFWWILIIIIVIIVLILLGFGAYSLLK